MKDSLGDERREIFNSNDGVFPEHEFVGVLRGLFGDYVEENPLRFGLEARRGREGLPASKMAEAVR